MHRLAGGTRLKMPFCIGSKTLKRVCCDKIIDVSSSSLLLPEDIP